LKIVTLIFTKIDKAQKQNLLHKLFRKHPVRENVQKVITTSVLLLLLKNVILPSISQKA